MEYNESVNDFVVNSLRDKPTSQTEILDTDEDDEEECRVCRGPVEDG
jgi:hypothetical protein